MAYLGPSGTEIGHKETMKDTARVLGRDYDAIEYRGFSQKTVEELAKSSCVPVYNGLTDEYHPTQVLADLLTMREHGKKPLRKVSFCFLGDAGNNMGDSPDPQYNVTLDFFRPGKPTDNAFIEAFNNKVRRECLNAHWFMSLDDARSKLEDWRRYYNEERPC